MQPNTLEINDLSYNRLSDFITHNYGIKLGSNKRTLVKSRLSSRIRKYGFNSFESYIGHAFQKENHAELNILVDLITTNKTDFFREASHFKYLTDNIIPELIENKLLDNTIKIWSAASSSGEELYTLAMVLNEYKRKNGLDYKLIGTDISLRMLTKARQAVYPLNRIYMVPDEMKKKYFLKSKEANSQLVKVKKELREKITFSQLNLMDNDYGQNKYHVIFCRNVLIYFDKENQEKVINKLTKNLITGGYLILGHSESLLGMDINVTQLQPTIYKKTA